MPRSLAVEGGRAPRRCPGRLRCWTGSSVPAEDAWGLSRPRVVHGGGRMQLETRYARLGRDRIAYQTLGEGPLVLVNAPGSFSHADVVLEDPAAVLYYRRLASFAKVIHFDRRGTGGSDPTPPSDARPPWQRYAEELTAVLDAAGVQRAAILAMFDVGPMAVGYSAANPDRTAALILANTSARHLAADDYPIGIPPEVAEALRAAMEESWGTEELVRLLVPSRGDDQRPAAGTPSCNAPPPAPRPSRPSC